MWYRHLFENHAIRAVKGEGPQRHAGPSNNRSKGNGVYLRSLGCRRAAVNHLRSGNTITWSSRQTATNICSHFDWHKNMSTNLPDTLYNQYINTSEFYGQVDKLLTNTHSVFWTHVMLISPNYAKTALRLIHTELLIKVQNVSIPCLNPSEILSW